MNMKKSIGVILMVLAGSLFFWPVAFWILNELEAFPRPVTEHISAWAVASVYYGSGVAILLFCIGASLSSSGGSRD